MRAETAPSLVIANFRDSPTGRDIFDYGRVLDGTYEIRSVIGAGGMGQVFEAVDRVLGRRVAIKALWPGTHQSRLRREAQALAAFWHPSLPVVHCLRSDQGTDFLVMERVYGVTLAEHIARIRQAGASSSVDDALKIIGSVAEALAVVHEAGLAHLDIKPQNVLLTPDGRAVLVDFGLALPEFDIASQARIAGSPRYMAPEVASEFLEPGAGRLADVYGLGVTLFELLTGDVPRDVKTFAELVELAGKEPVDVHALRPDLTPALRDLVNEMVAAEPGLRPQSADAVMWGLRAVRRGSGRVAAPVKVLIVEDDRAVARTLEFYARRSIGNVEIRVVHDGASALAELHRYTPDVMLLDLHMPVMSGIEVCMYVRGVKIAEQCTIVPVTAGAGQEDQELLRTLGIRHFLVKDENLSRRVEAILKSLCSRS